MTWAVFIAGVGVGWLSAVAAGGYLTHRDYKKRDRELEQAIRDNIRRHRP